jgi:hypothetical protein
MPYALTIAPEKIPEPQKVTFEDFRGIRSQVVEPRDHPFGQKNPTKPNFEFRKETAGF